MTGGRHALKGFDYQAVVTLDVLLQALINHQNVSVRPEGEDDLVLHHHDGHDHRRRFYQVKKPRENDQGAPRNSPWTLSQAAHELLPQTLRNLRGNTDEQIWVLGDAASDELVHLVAAGRDAFEAATDAYLEVLHILALDTSKVVRNARQDGQRALANWRPRRDGIPATSFSEARRRLIENFGANAQLAGVTAAALDSYERALAELHLQVPDALARTTLHTTYGSEEDIAQRVQEALRERYNLSPEVVRDTLYLNVRGFVNDVAKQPGRTIDAEELELELRSVWPQMNVVRRPPPWRADDLPRAGLVTDVLSAMGSGVVEVVGISGSGKTTLAALVAHAAEERDPRRLVLYAECREGHTMRDVLVGLSFHLRRFSDIGPFAAATVLNDDDETVVTNVTRALGGIHTPVTLLVDLVDGRVTDRFARLAAHFAAEVQGAPVETVFFGHEPALRHLTGLERRALRLPPVVDVPGLTFEEFVDLVSRRLTPDREALYRVYRHLTANRAAGLPAVFAAALATLPASRLDEYVALPPEVALQAAEQDRFNALPAAVRTAAERLVCLVLPFRPDEAQDAFPEQPVLGAVTHLKRHGLLRDLDGGRVEMHETVRRGLEAFVPPALRREIHGHLAEYYLSRSAVAAAVHHLEESGQGERARDVAREAFTGGNERTALLAYVLAHGLITSDDVLSWLDAPDLPSDTYWWPLALAQGSSAVADALLHRASAHPTRFVHEYNWARVVSEGVLRADPRSLTRLVQLALRIEGGKALGVVRLAVRRTGVSPDDSLLAQFVASSPDEKVALLPVLLTSPSREVLQLAVPAVAELGSRWSEVNGCRPTPPWQPHVLYTAANVEHFLEALPPPDLGQELATRTVQFGQLTEWVWAEREALRRYGPELLERAQADAEVLRHALRILIFLGDERAIQLARPLEGREDVAGAFAPLVPIFFPGAVDLEARRTDLLNPARSISQRLIDLAVFARVGGDLDEAFERLLTAEPEHTPLWRYSFLLQALFAPFHAAVTVLRELLADCTDEESVKLFSPLLYRLSELPGEDVTTLLVDGIQHASHTIRTAALSALSRRRARSALPALSAYASAAPDGPELWLAFVAALASHPQTMGDLDAFWPRLAQDKQDIGRATLAGRLGAVEEGRWVADVATDTQRSWRVRRAALLAAAHLPFEVALEACAERVLAERSTLTADTSASLHGHFAVSSLIAFDPTWLMQVFTRGRGEFIAAFTPLIGSCWANATSAYDAPDPTNVTTWLYDRLALHGAPSLDASRRVDDEVHVPMLQAAVLRGLRLTGRLDLLEDVTCNGYSEWCIMRALMERLKSGDVNDAVLDRLQGAVDTGAFRQSVALRNVLRHTQDRRTGDAPPFTDYAVEPTATIVTPDTLPDLLATAEPPTAPYVLQGFEKMALHRLTIDLAPERDSRMQRVVPTEPRLLLTSGQPVVDGTRVEYGAPPSPARKHLRPALAVALLPDTPSWHARLMWGDDGAPERPEEITAFVLALAAWGGGDALLSAMEAHGPRFTLALCHHDRIAAAKRLIDERAVPHLVRVALCGTDNVLAGLCDLASAINHEDARPLLTILFGRWANRARTVPGVRLPVELWWAFRGLMSHPITRTLPEFVHRLVEVTQRALAWWDRLNLLDDLITEPAAYATLEGRLWNTSVFEHFWRDEVDALDDAAESLFSSDILQFKGSTNSS